MLAWKSRSGKGRVEMAANSGILMICTRSSLNRDTEGDVLHTPKPDNGLAW